MYYIALVRRLVSCPHASNILCYASSVEDASVCVRVQHVDLGRNALWAGYPARALPHLAFKVAERLAQHFISEMSPRQGVPEFRLQCKEL